MITRVTFLALLLGAALTQVLGIDVGTEFWKAGLISPGRSFAAVENSKSDRKTVNSLAIKEGVRYFQDESLKVGNRFVDTGFFYLKKYFEVQGDATRVAALQKEFNEKNDYKVENGTLYFSTKDEEGKSEYFSLEQLQGMIFRSLKSNAKKMAGSQPKDVVLVVPADWDLDARAAFLNAAAIGGFNVLSVITENTAASVHYALSRNDSEPVNVLFTNLGYRDFHLTLVEYSGVVDKVNNKSSESVRVLHEEVVEGVGSFNFNNIILQHIEENFQAKRKESLYDAKNLRALRKAMLTSEKTKETLSASKEVSIYIEGLVSGYDYSSLITKADFNDKAKPLLQKIKVSIEQFLQRAKVSKENVKSVELIGGGIRVPAIVSSINETMAGSDVGTHINGDESMALGAVFLAANQSSSYRVKKVYLQDGFPFELQAYIKSKGGVKLFSGKLFEKRDYFGLAREFSFDPVKVGQQIEITILKDGQPLKIFNFPKLEEALKDKKFQNSTEKFNFTFLLKLDSVNVVKVAESKLINNVNVSQFSSEVKYQFVEEELNITKNETGEAEEVATQGNEEGTEEAKTEGTEEGKAEEGAEEGKTEDTEQGKAEDTEQGNAKDTEQGKVQEKTEQKESEKEGEEKVDDKAESKSDQSERAKTEAEQGAEATNATKKKKKEKLTRLKPIRKVVNTTRYSVKEVVVNVPAELKQQSYRGIYDEDEIYQLQKRIVEMEQKEEQKRQRTQLKNTLESTIYQFGDYLKNDQLLRFLKSDETKVMGEAVTVAKDWLQANSQSASNEVLRSEYDKLIDSFQPLRNRTEERKNIETTYNKTASAMKYLIGKYVQLQKSNPFLKEMIDKEVDSIVKTMEDIVGKINSTFEGALNENPKVYCWELVAFANQAREKYIQYSSIPKPKKAETQKNEEQPKAEQGADKDEGKEEDKEEGKKDNKDQEKDNKDKDNKDQEKDNKDKDNKDQDKEASTDDKEDRQQQQL